MSNEKLENSLETLLNHFKPLSEKWTEIYHNSVKNDIIPMWDGSENILGNYMAFNLVYQVLEQLNASK